MFLYSSVFVCGCVCVRVCVCFSREYLFMVLPQWRNKDIYIYKSNVRSLAG